MIIIKKLAIGNTQEAFIEDNFDKGINIIYSDDNNRGKTIVSQGLFYALGNEPIFPSSFQYTNYYFIVELEVNDNSIILCRKNKTFLVKDKKGFSLFNNTSEFKRYFNKTIFKLPLIIKDKSQKMVDLELFFQLFFVGQDKRNTSDIFNSGYNKKDDFINLLYSYAGCTEISTNSDTNKVKNKIKELKTQRNIILKQNEILKENIPAFNIASYAKQREDIIKKLNTVEQIKTELTDLIKDRNRTLNKKIKNEILLAELNSLNRTLDEGELICMDCKGSHIGYRNQSNGLNFDVSDVDIRKNIIETIENRIIISEEEASKLEVNISDKQKELNRFLNENDDVSLKNLLLYKSELKDASEIDNDIINIDNEIDELNTLLYSAQNAENKLLISKKELENKIFEEMNSFYKTMNPKGNLLFNTLFTKRGETYSGCEASEYYLSKTYAFAKIFKHPFPILIDAFRDGELSSKKEKVIIEYYSKLPNQVIFTATLKDEEENKYNNYKSINKMDYSEKEDSHILNKNDLTEFIELTKALSININE